MGLNHSQMFYLIVYTISGKSSPRQRSTMVNGDILSSIFNNSAKIYFFQRNLAVHCVDDAKP